MPTSNLLNIEDNPVELISSLSLSQQDYLMQNVGPSTLFFSERDTEFSTTVGRVRVNSGGSGYTSVPGISIAGGGGTGATAIAVLVSGVVTEITLVTPGSGYTSAPSVSFIGGGGTGATATAVLIGLVPPVGAHELPAGAYIGVTVQASQYIYLWAFSRFFTTIVVTESE